MVAWFNKRPSHSATNEEIAHWFRKESSFQQPPAVSNAEIAHCFRKQPSARSNLDVVLAIKRQISLPVASTADGALDQSPKSPSHEAGMGWRQDVTSTVTQVTLFGDQLGDPLVGPEFSLAAGRKTHQELRIARSPSPERTKVPQGIPAWLAADQTQRRSQTNKSASADVKSGCKERWQGALQKDGKDETILKKVLANRDAEHDISEIESRIAHLEATRSNVLKAETAFARAVKEPLRRRLVASTNSDSSCVFADAEIEAGLRLAEYRQQLYPYGQPTGKTVKKIDPTLLNPELNPLLAPRHEIGRSDTAAARVLDFFHA